MATRKQATQRELAAYTQAFAKGLSVFLHELGMDSPEALASTPPNPIPRGRAADPELEEELRNSVEVTPALLSEVIRERLKEALAESRMSQRDLARKLGVSPAVITRIFQHPDRSRLDTLLRLAKAMNTDLGSLLGNAAA